MSVPLSCSGSLRVLGAFFVKQPKATPRYRFRVPSIRTLRSLVARLLLVTGSHVLCCTVSFSSRRRQRTLQFSPNHVGNFLAPRACLAYISHCTRRVFCIGYNYRQSHKVPIHAIKPFFSRTPRHPTRSSLFLFVPPHFANFRRRTRLPPPPPRFLFRVSSWHALCRTEESMPVARDDKYHLSSKCPDSGSLGLL